ncbi:nuclear transport factor 2 family protein, partial [Amycolatopsis magusensis]
MRTLFLFCLCLLVSFATLAQTKKIPSPQPKTTAEAKAVEQAVVTFFDAMRTSDSTLARSVLAPNARLISVAANKEGTVLPRETPIQKFVEMIGQKHPQVLDERIWDVKVSIDGD